MELTKEEYDSLVEELNKPPQINELLMVKRPLIFEKDL